MPIPKAISKEDILWAADQIDRGITHEFGAPTRYAVVINGKEYPPKAVVGVAALKATGKMLLPGDFSSGVGRGQAVDYLRQLGFEVRVKDTPEPFVQGQPYTREDIQRLLGLTPVTGGDWFTGYHKEGDDWFLFPTVGSAGRTGHNYGNRWEGEHLRWWGRTGSRIDQPRTQDLLSDDARVRLFTRDADRGPFTYHGLVRPIEVVPSVPVQVMWEIVGKSDAPTMVTMPEEAAAQGELREGSVRQVLVNAYERNPEARKRCVEHWGAKCIGCGLDMASRYGEIAQGFIHVHHLKRIADMGAEYVVDPIHDLAPLCPNCHAVVHLADPPLTIAQLQELLKGGKSV